MSKKQSGFSAVAALLVVVLIGIIGGTGWYVVNANNKANDTLNNSGLGIAAKPSQKKQSAPAPLPASAPSQDTATQINAILNKGDYQGLAPYMTDSINLVIQSTDFQGDGLSKSKALETISSYLVKSKASLGAELPWDFTGHSDFREKISKTKPCCINTFIDQGHIGISKDNWVVSYRLNNDQKIEAFYIAVSVDTLQ
jgi:hypothetical protein